MPRAATCQMCGETFVAYAGRPKYCGDACRKKAIRERVRVRAGRPSIPDETTCTSCGDTFKPQRSNSKHCPKCVRRRGQDPDKPSVLTCEHCGQQFKLQKPSRKPQPYCSYACADEVESQGTNSNTVAASFVQARKDAALFHKYWIRDDDNTD